MKILRILFLSATLTLSCSLPALAAGTFSSAADLWTFWQESPASREESPYPSYICGVWSTDGSQENLTFSVTKDEAGEAGKAEILELVEDDSTVSFTYQSYPHEELWAIQLELEPWLGDATGAYGIGVYEMENTVVISINTDHPKSEAFMQDCFAAYGDRIRFETGSGLTFTAGSSEIGVISAVGGLAFTEETGGSGAADIGGSSTQRSVWLWLFAAVLAMAGAAAWSGHLPLLQTVGGKNTTIPTRMTRRETAEAVRQSSCSPRPEIRQAILREIDESPRP